MGDQCQGKELCMWRTHKRASGVDFGNRNVGDKGNNKMKLLFENWRKYLNEELTNQNSEFKTWHEEVIKHLTKDGYDPAKYEKGAKRSYLDGETTVDYEIGW